MFEEGNEAYSAGNYKEAVRQYEQVLENGETSAEVYYNLGNAYYKLEEVAPAIFYFEKALQLAPNDEDIQTNLAFAREMTVDAVEEIETTGVDRFTNDIVSSFGANVWGWLAVAFSFSFLILFGLYYFSTSPVKKRIFFTIGMVGLGFAIVSATLGYFKYSEMRENNFAIIFTESVEIKNEPNLRANEIFTLHEGTKVEIKETFQDWIKVELTDGKQGWMQREQVKTL